MRGSIRFHKSVNFATGLALTAVIWWIDRLAPPQVSMSIFYLLPIGFVSWFCGGAWAYASSIICAAAWFQAERSAEVVFTHSVIPYWNALVRFGYFTIMVALSQLVIRLRHLSEHEQKVSELKSNMISLVSHEFGNSLTILKLSLTLLEESHGDVDDAKKQRCYSNLNRVYTHLSGAVANFLNLNRIESGRFIPHMGETALRTVVHSAVAQLGPLIETKNLELRLDFPPERVPVKADPDALSVVMTNLIGNAIKYTPAGGKVTVRIVSEAASGTALVSVEDTGIGIPEADQLMITSGFYRAEGGRKEAKGFGVGLNVTHELLKSQGARLEIKSEPGHGSKFFFRLPLWTGQKPLSGKAELNRSGG